MLNLIFLFFLVLISLAAGRKIFKLCKVNFDSLLEEFVFSTGVGLGLVSYLTLTLGLLGLLYWWACLLLLIALFVFALREIWEAGNVVRIVGQKVREFFPLKRKNIFVFALSIVLFAQILLAFIASLAPVTDWDSGCYHLAIPKLWIQHHKIIYIPYILESEFPLTTETLYGLGLALADDVSANLIIWAISILFLFAIFSLCRRYFSVKVGLLSSAAFYCTPLVGMLASGTMMELAIGYYAFLGLYAFLKYLDTNDYKMLALAAVTSGLAAATKHTGIIPFVLLFIGVIIVEIKRRKFSIAAFKGIALCSLAFLLIPSPWYIKSFINTGNPVIPFFHEIFGGKNLPAEVSELSFVFAKSYGIDTKAGFIPGLIIRVKSLLNPFFFGGWSAIVGPFFLAFVPCLGLMKGVSKTVKYLLIYSIGGLIFGSIFTTSSRYMIPVYSGFFIAGAYAAYRLIDSYKPLNKVVPVIILASLLFNIIPVAGLAYIRLPVAIGLETREHYLSRRIEMYDVAEYINHNLSDDVKILTMDPRGYYLDKPHIMGARGRQGYIRYDNIHNVSQVLDMLKKHQITHLLINEVLIKGGPDIERVYPFIPHDLHLSDLKSHMTIVHTKNDVYLYKLNIAD